MTSPTRAFQEADEGRLELDAVVGALADRYTVASRPPRTVRRRRLDTFDRRLQGAGLTLEHRIEPRDRRLVLAGADGTTAGSVVGDLRWPTPADALPAGPIRAAIVPVAGLRALLVVSDERRSQRLLELHNADGKTVVRIELDEPVDGAGAPGTVTVRALRGYDEHASRVDRLLVRLGLRPVEVALEAVADGTVALPPVDRDAPATDVLVVAMTEFLAAMRATLPGLLADVDTEFLHDFRVALRRTRTTLRLGRDVLPAEFRSDWEPAFAWLGALTTPVRDLDVYELGLPTMAGWLVAAEAGDLEAFARHLERRRSTARGAMVRGLRSVRFRRLLAGWEHALADLGAGAAAAGVPTSAGTLAGRSLARAHRRVLRDGAAITCGAPADDLHRLRGRCKELRYALEIFAPVLDAGTARRAISELKGLQDVLGRFQDAEVQRHALREFAEEMMVDGVPAAALLVLGELIAHLEAEQGRARGEFDQVFARFARRPTSSPLHRLGGPA